MLDSSLLSTYFVSLPSQSSEYFVIPSLNCDVYLNLFKMLMQSVSGGIILSVQISISVRDVAVSSVKATTKQPPDWGLQCLDVLINWVEVACSTSHHSATCGWQLTDTSGLFFSSLYILCYIEPGPANLLRTNFALRSMHYIWFRDEVIGKVCV